MVNNQEVHRYAGTKVLRQREVGEDRITYRVVDLNGSHTGMYATAQLVEGHYVLEAPVGGGRVIFGVKHEEEVDEVERALIAKADEIVGTRIDYERRFAGISWPR
jgi:hypothetical protein